MYRASLCISSKNLSAREINSTLEIQPSASYEKGSPLSKRRPEGRLREVSSWILDSNLHDTEEEDSLFLENYIEDLLSIIESNLTNFSKLSSDCTIEIYCSYFAENIDISKAVSLSSDLIKRLAIIPLDLTIVMYPPETEN